PLHGDAGAADERGDDPERFLEPADAVVERISERRVLRLVPAAAEPEDQPPAGDLVGRDRHLSEQPGRSKGRRQDERAELDAARRRGEGAEDRPRLVVPDLRSDRRTLVAGEEVVAEPEAVDPALLRPAGHREDLAPRPTGAVLWRLREHDPDAHLGLLSPDWCRGASGR